MRLLRVRPRGARVRVAVDDDRGFGWNFATMIGHTTIGGAVHPGGWPTYRVRTDDGRTYDYASPECVRAAPAPAAIAFLRGSAS